MRVIYHSPIGDLTISGTEDYITAISYGNKGNDTTINNLYYDCIKQLEEYFSGHLTEFTINYKLNGTPLQLKVWEALSKIPYGTSVSYQDIGERIGNKKAVRAIGQAIGRNPLLIIIPCHRVIGKDKSLTGFSCGKEIKIKLLDHEKIVYKKAKR